jgi:hypothetical protein
MRTSLPLDDDVAAALVKEAERRGVSADQLANDELRAKFCQEQPGSRKPFVIKTFSSAYQPGIDPSRLKDYLYQEDDERFRRASRQSDE